MDSKCRLNKTEMLEIKRMLESFVESDPTIQINKIKETINEKMTKEVQKIFDKYIEITPEIKAFFYKHSINDTQCFYISNCFKYSNEDFSMPSSKYTNNYDFLNVYVKVYEYKLGWRVMDNSDFRTEVIKTFAEVCKDDWKNLIQAAEKYNKIITDMIIVLNSLKTAQAVLDKFGFIESINKYINNLLLQQAKPISCMTQAVEKSVDNYLNSRKSVDEQ